MYCYYYNYVFNKSFMAFTLHTFNGIYEKLIMFLINYLFII